MTLAETSVASTTKTPPLNTMTLCLFDPGLQDRTGKPAGNLGNLVIQQAVTREIEKIFKDWNIIRLSTFSTPNADERRQMRSADVTIAGGTNLLNSEMNRYRQWVISMRHAPGMTRAHLLGVGWWRYEGNPNLFTRIFLKFLLTDRGIHSVRDGYTESKLRSIGYRNVVNTACPTMWPLVDARPEEFPQQKARNVLITLTDYSKHLEYDRKLIELLSARYEKLFVFPQGQFDLNYLSTFKANWQILERDFQAFNAFIRSEESFDFIGTRLHGGIHCLNHRRRALILEVDNRAKEIAKDTGLTTVAREDLDQVRDWIDHPRPFKIRLPVANIERWRQQFSTWTKN